MRAWVRASVVPLIAITLWLIPSGGAGTEVAGALEIAPLADAAAQAASSGSQSAPVESTSTVPTISTTTTTTIAPETSSSLATPVDRFPRQVVDGESSSVSSTSTVSTTTTEASISLGEQALQLVAYPWKERFPDWTVEFLGPRNGLRALTYPADKRIEIFVRSSDTAATLHRVLAHEIGHVVDVELNSDQDRERWLSQRGVSNATQWWPNAQAPDFATGAGDFAEAFAVWETGVTTRSTLAGQPTRSDLDVLRELSQG